MNRILSLIGVVLVTGSLYWFGGGPPDGPYESYYENGQLQVKGTYKDGELDGLVETYHENGQLSERGTYPDGPFEMYYENGQLDTKGTYKDGERCGEWLDFSETVTHDPC